MLGRLHGTLGLLAACAGFCLGPGPLQGQDAVYRPALRQLRAELDSTRSFTEVDAVAARWDASGPRAVRRLGAAYVELQRGVVTNSRLVLTSAWERFDQVVRVHPDWPYARLGLAEAALEVYSRRYPLPASYDDVAGGTHYDGYAIQMTRTLRAEPSFQPAVNWLAGTLSQEGDRDQPGAILEALQYIADSTSSSDPRVQLILARAERLQGDPRQSVRRLEAYLREGGDTGVANLELARSLAWMGVLDNAAAEYMAGAAVQTDRARAIYRLDLSWVATPRELARFDSLPADSVGTFIGRFWGKRDVQDLRPDGSRLQEHLRRWVYVSKHFRVPDPGRRTAYRAVFIPYSGTPCQRKGANSLDDYAYMEPARQGGYRSPERVFDHRAIVYMRHGAPLYRLGGDALGSGSNPSDRANSKIKYADVQAERRRLTGSVNPPAGATTLVMDADRNVTWVYLIGGQLRTFTFLGHQALGTNRASTLIVSVPPNLDVILQLAQLSSDYASLAGVAQWQAAGGSMIPLECQGPYLDVVGRQRDDAAVAVKTDTYLRRFAKPLTTAIQLAAMGQPLAGGGELLAVVGVRARDLKAEPVAGDSSAVTYVLRLQLAAIDSVTGEAVQMDTVRSFTATPQMAQGKAWLSFLVKLPLMPGLDDVRLSVEQDDGRGSVFGASIRPAGTGFALSDIVLGSARGSLPWRREGATVAVSPFSVFEVGESVPLYYELYGLNAGEYRTVVTLRRVGERKVASSITFTDHASTPTIAANRILTLNELRAGPYDLSVSIEEVSTGKRVERRRAISVVDR